MAGVISGSFRKSNLFLGSASYLFFAAFLSSLCFYSISAASVSSSYFGKSSLGFLQQKHLMIIIMQTIRHIPAKIKTITNVIFNFSSSSVGINSGHND